MRLYKMELYKLCHRKIFVIGSGCVFAILLFFFYMLVSQEQTYVDGVTYYGYHAIQVNRQITEEFKGVITDEKAEKIIEKYGFPQRVEEYYGYYTDKNFLNKWVEENLSDGYYRGWEDYQIASCIYPIADTELKEVSEAVGGEIVLDYSDGWETFMVFLTLGLILGSILVLFAVSIVFANEEQTKMLPLLFTTKEGKKKDIILKIAAAFTVTFVIWFSIVILAFLLCGVVYGFGGLKCLAGLSIINFISIYRQATLLPMNTFLIITLFRSLLGMLLLCAATIYISAGSKSSFHAVTRAALCWLAPILIWVIIMGGGIRGIISMFIKIFIYASPIYLIRYDALLDYYRIWVMMAGISAAGVLGCGIGSYVKYKKQTA